MIVVMLAVLVARWFVVALLVEYVYEHRAVKQVLPIPHHSTRVSHRLSAHAAQIYHSSASVTAIAVADIQDHEPQYVQLANAAVS